MFPTLPCLPFFFRCTLEFTWYLTFSSKPFIMVIKKHMCVFCFLSCLLSLHWFFVWNYSYYTSTELLARYKSMWISLFTSICLPNIFYRFIILFSPPPPPVFVCAKQAAVQPCILPVNYFFTHKQCSYEKFNYLCWWHLSWPTPTRFLPSPPCLSGNFLHFPSIICMCVVFELKGKRKKGRKLK